VKLVGYIEEPLGIIMLKYQTNLYDLIHGRYYSDEEIMSNIKTKYSIAIGIAKGMSAIHECSVIHLDLKSSNILVNEEGYGVYKPYITDFGKTFFLDFNISSFFFFPCFKALGRWI